MKKIIIIILFVIGVSYIFANCDMIAMIAKEGNTISQFGNSSGTYEYPLDFFEYLMQRSINSGTKANPNGYGVIFYHSNSTIITYDPTNLYNEDNEAWYLVDWNNNSDNYYHGTEYNTDFDDNDALNQAYDVILNQHGCENTEASIVLGHARKGTTGTGSHPFRFNLGDKTFTFIQNGGLENGINPNEPNIKLALHTELNSVGWFSNHSFNWIDDPANAGIDQFIDSELLFHWIMKNIIDSNGSVLEGCNRALTATVNGIDLSQELLTPYGYHNWINCVNFILSDGEKLYVFRNSESEDPDNDIWHNLSYSDLDEFYAIKTYGTELSTRIDQYDMVCFSKDEDPIEYPNFLDIDVKTFNTGIQWVSFPTLSQQYTSNGESYEQFYWNSLLQTPGLIQETSGGSPTIDEFLRIDGYRNGDISIVPVNNNFVEHDEGFDNMLFRHEGYKIEVDDGADETILVVDGDRLTSYTFDMPALQNFWLGYYIPYPQNIEAAFDDEFHNVNRIWAEDWYYDAHKIQRGLGAALPSNSTVGKTMEYGKMYIVQMYESVKDFSWYGSSTVEEPTKKAESQNFDYIEKMDYEVIDVVDIPSNVTEIGVFEEDICVGAVIVEDESAQILVYSENANRNPVPFTFQIVTGRSLSTSFSDYLVLNQETGEFETSEIISGRQQYSAMKFTGNIEPDENSVAVIELHGNHPNPFNPETNISFSIPEEQKIQLSIYNLKGQKVKELINGQFVSGKHSIVWNGKDDNGKSVGSGMYFYKLKTNGKQISKKMLLLK